MENILILVIIVLIASTLQTTTGYGFSVIGTPFLLLIFPAHMAIQINIILSIFLSFALLFTINKEIDRRLLSNLVKGSIFGLILGILIYLFLDTRLLKMLIGALILVLTVLLISKLTIRQTRNRDVISGGFSGLLTSSIGAPGPPLLLYFSGTNMDKTTIRSTSLAYYLFVYSASLLLQIGFGSTNKETWLFSLVALPSLFVGLFLGQNLFKMISQKVFRIITFIILIFAGIYLFVSGL